MSISQSNHPNASPAVGLRFELVRRFGIIFVICVWWSAVVLKAEEPLPALLTNAAQVISLPAEIASRSLKVSVKGIVTAADPTLLGRFFMQDSTSGVFVDNANGLKVKPGDIVEVNGITYAGAYAPTITAPSLRIIGHKPLPAPKTVSAEELMSGADDSQRIEISGIVHHAGKNGARLDLDLVAGGYQFRAYLSDPYDIAPDQLIGAEVRVRGTAAEAHNRSLRQLIAVEVYIPRAEDLTILKTEPVDPFARAIIPLNQLAQYRPGNSLARRVHIRGVCTLHNPDEVLFVQDSIYGLQIQSRHPPPVSQGDVIEAVGFLNFENYHPVLQDAIVRKTGDAPRPINFRPAEIEEIQSGYFHASPVTLTGKLTECTVRPGLEGDLRTAITTLVLQSSNYYFSAIARGLADQAKLSLIPLGSVLQTKGVCVTEIDKDGKLEGFQILLARPHDVLILERPSWFTPQHLMICMAGGGIALVVIAIWLIMVARRNSILHLLVREREKAQFALQEANDQLEQRVKERTNQLKFQITARKEAEVQFKAVLSERTRLAQELHDTVEQTLTGISFQMDVAAKQHDGNPANSLHHLELARSLMAKSKEEVRQSIWDLRSRALEQFDLSNALAEAARQTTSGSNITVHYASKGRVRPLPEIIEENLLRIGQEAITNVMKHSRATTLDITLTFDPKQVVLQIKDNGAGFDQNQAAGPQQGHFGLLGMSERAKRLGGKLLIESPPGNGTLLLAIIPLDLPPNLSAPIIDQA